MKRMPWFPQYANDRLADWRLRGCALASHGLFFNIQLLAHEHSGRLPLPGVLSREGMIAELVRATGKPEPEIAAAVDELLGAGALEWNAPELMVPCMTREYDRRAKASEAGHSGVARRLALAKGASQKGTLKGSHKGTHQLEQNRAEQNRAESTAGLTPDALLALYNELRGKLRKATALTPRRRKLAQAAILRHPEADFWREAIQRAARSTYLPSAGWWHFGKLLDEDTLVRLGEGGYDQKFSSGPAPASPVASAHGPRPASLEETRRRYLDKDDKAASA